MPRLRLKRTEPVAPEEPAEQAASGVLTEWNDERGYGFLAPDAGGPRVFLHVKALAPAARRPRLGEHFRYLPTTDERGRPRAAMAVQTDTLSEKRPLPFHHWLLKSLVWLWPLALIPPLAMIGWTGSLLAGVALAFAQNSLMTMLFYVEDKHLAQYKYWRIPEKLLHIWEFLCGWPGAWYAQHVFWHKRSKTNYMIVFWLCVLLNIGCVALLFVVDQHLPLGAPLHALWQELTAF